MPELSSSALPGPEAEVAPPTAGEPTQSRGPGVDSRPALDDPDELELLLDLEEILQNYKTPPPKRTFQVNVTYHFRGKAPPMPCDLEGLELADLDEMP
jgi:hypothetical protein